ncbi:hypothetical protein QBC35DRAFT_37967 [Podospora australis]|uniref:Protein kinase domain-containing protein n=1 Tax=Podospora australis TaxID=1536484 RepID=A0AAN7ADU8_9PEZI|nr:hypothetical protein QBC35DRAFT_37967 [Podospora australis]
MRPLSYAVFRAAILEALTSIRWPTQRSNEATETYIGLSVEAQEDPPTIITSTDAEPSTQDNANNTSFTLWHSFSVKKLSTPEPSVIVIDLGEEIRAKRKATNSSDKPTNSAQTGLGNQLLTEFMCQPSARLYPNFPDFLPRKQLETTVTEDVVREKLHKNRFESVLWGMVRRYWRNKGKKDDEKDIELTNFTKIMAILLLMEHPSRIKYFFEEGVSDADLPFEIVYPNAESSKRRDPRREDPKRKNSMRKAPGHFELRRQNDPKTRLRCFRTWTKQQMEKFVYYQWAVLAPFFSRDPDKPRTIPHYVIPRHVIIPFQEWELITCSTGFGDVYRVKIHEDHHDFSNLDVSPGLSLNSESTKKGCFAVKRLRSQDPAAFKREVEVLRKFSKQEVEGRHHLITLLATYVYQEQYHLIFPLAESNLSVYWRDNTSPINNDITTVRWMAEQCRGLASSLASIHQYNRTDTDTFSLFPGCNLAKLTTIDHRTSLNAGHDAPGSIAIGPPRMVFCRHGDIKPENILWFSSPPGMGTLKITDFGTADFMLQDNVPRTPEIPKTHMYEAPEACLVFTTGIIGTSSDIWSLGCVYLEFIAWLLGGWDGIDRFLDERLAQDNEVLSTVHTGTFFYIKKEINSNHFRAEVKDSVLKFIKKLHGHPKCTDFLHGFLDLLKEDMLIIESTAGHPRLGAAMIAARLGEWVQGPDSYFTMPAPKLL